MTSSRVPINFSPCVENQAGVGPETYSYTFRAVTSLLADFFHYLLDLGDGLLPDLLDSANHLIGLALRAQLVIACQRAGSFLDPAFNHVCLTTHDEDSYC